MNPCGLNPLVGLIPSCMKGSGGFANSVVCPFPWTVVNAHPDYTPTNLEIVGIIRLRESDPR
jgi:hypothetical protein